MFRDPSELYEQWLKSVTAAWGLTQSSAEQRPPSSDVGALWRLWFDAVLGPWRQAATSGQRPDDAMTRLMANLEDALRRMVSGQGFAVDPIDALWQWYEANSDAWAKTVEAMLGSEAYLEAAGRALDTYVTTAGLVRRVAEANLKRLELPTRADIARVAGLVVSAEEKIDHVSDLLEESFDHAVEPRAGLAEHALEARLSRIEEKLDRLLAALDSDAHAAPTVPRARSKASSAAAHATPPTAASTTQRRAARGGAKAPRASAASARRGAPVADARTTP
ncbi:MAG TPA: hypothetical protein VKC57_10265 [Ktedonobacterales bacterium]|nr:hypothetical protein [Ktedonobacterales bacterium]